MFIEISNNIPGAGIDLDDWNASYEGCNCTHYCYSMQPTATADANNSCSCISYHKIKPYKMNNKSNMVINLDLIINSDAGSSGNAASTIVLKQINECSLECSCDQQKCLNRLVQHGVKFDLEIFECIQVEKGKGVRAREHIEAGSFVCEYMGEVISENEAELRFNQRSMLHESNFILLLREHYSTQDVQVTCIDAKHYGNVGRFINHSCDPNLVIIPVRIDNVIPHAALFACRDISVGEELSYDYNGSGEVNKTEEETSTLSENKCFCMATKCSGYLPANQF